MRYVHYDVQGPEIHIYSLVCMHLGAKQSSMKLIRKTIDMIKADPLAKWIYMGDAGECVTKSSKGNIYEQLMNPGDQMRQAAELMGEIKDKGLFGIRGNHGNRIDKESGVGWDEMLCARVGIPYLGVSAFAGFSLETRKIARADKAGRINASVYVHHGSASGTSPAGKMTAGHKAESFIMADVILTAHTHACGECWPPKYYAYLDNKAQEVKWGITRSYVCGSAYDSRSGYAEEKMYTPMLPEYLMVSIAGRRSYLDGKDKCVLDITHKKIELGAEEFEHGREVE